MSKGINNKVNFLKFAFSILIVVRHFLGQYSGVYEGEIFELWSKHGSYFGLFGVTFFFIVSGYFMTAAAMKAPDTNCAEQAIGYVLGKYKKQFRVYFAALLFAFIFYCITTPAENRTAMYSVLVELFALQCSGLPCELLNAPTWYISAMLIAMLPLYFLNTRYKKTYLNVIAPLGALLILGYSYRMSSGNLADGGIYYRLGRAFWGLMLGSVCYLASDKLKNVKRLIATIIEAAMWVLICWYLFCEKRLFNYSSNAVVIVALTIALSFTFSKQSYTHVIFDKAEKICTLLGKWSVYIYFNHWTVLTIVYRYSVPHHPVPAVEFMKLIALTALLSVIEFLIFRLIDKLKANKQIKQAV